MNNRKDNLEQNIMSKIRSGQVGMRSKYVFLAEKLGLGSATALSVLLAVVFCAFALLYAKITDNLMYLSFGKDGLFAFLESFPYAFVIGFIGCLLLAGYLITRAEWSYKHPFGFVAVGLVVAVLGIAGAIAYTDMFEQQVLETRVPGLFAKPFDEHMRKNGIAGKVFEVGDGYAILQTPRGFEKIEYDGQAPAVGEFIVGTGVRTESAFEIKRMRVVDEDAFPRMTERAIRGKVPQGARPQEHLLHFDENTKACMRECFDSRGFEKRCFKECAGYERRMK